MVAPDEVAVPALTAEITGGTATLFTVIEMLLVAVLPAVSLAIADSVCGPLAAVAVFQE
jgi:hypothetical protein